MAFKARLVCPTESDSFFSLKNEKGVNPYVRRASGSKLIFQNCVYWAGTRFAEITGIWLPSTNAENFANEAKKLGLKISDKPALGAIAVWAKGKVGNSNDGAGHVAIVESISGNFIVTSESGWSASKAFWTTTRTKGSNENWGQSSSYTFIGFVLPPETQTVANTALRKGDNGEAVKKLQTALANEGYLRKSEIDGDFGKITLGALLAFQFENGLEVDGVCGAKTKAKLGGI